MKFKVAFPLLSALTLLSGCYDPASDPRYYWPDIDVIGVELETAQDYVDFMVTKNIMCMSVPTRGALSPLDPGTDNPSILRKVYRTTNGRTIEEQLIFARKLLLVGRIIELSWEIDEGLYRDIRSPYLEDSINYDLYYINYSTVVGAREYYDATVTATLDGASAEATFRFGVEFIESI